MAVVAAVDVGMDSKWLVKVVEELISGTDEEIETRVMSKAELFSTE
jgi:hypothetical protein